MAKMTPPMMPMPPRTPRMIHSAERSLESSLPLGNTPWGATAGLFMMGLGTTPGLTPMLGTPTFGMPGFGMPALGTLGKFGTPGAAAFGPPRSGSRAPGLGMTGGLKPGLGAAGGLKPGLGPKFGGGICGKPGLPIPGRGSSVGRPKASTLENLARHRGQLVDDALTR